MAEVMEKQVLTKEPEYQMEWLKSPKRVRVMFDGKYLADSRHAMLLRESGRRPEYYFPADDVRTDLLHPTDHVASDPHKGEAHFWTIRTENREVKNAVWSYPDPEDEAAPLAGYLAFYWDKVDAWFEEDQQVYVHPRDPYARLDTLRSSCHVKVVIGDRVVAETDRPTLLFETGLPTRYYIPPVDVNMEYLFPSDTITRCPYKGEARYYSIRIDGKVYPDLVWYYPYPTTEVAGIQGQLCFYAEKTESFTVDGKEPPNAPCFPRR